MAHLLGSKDHRDHALWLRGLGALVDKNGAELHLGKPGVPCTHTRAADDVRVLGKRVCEHQEHLQQYRLPGAKGQVGRTEHDTTLVPALLTTTKISSLSLTALT